MITHIRLIKTTTEQPKRIHHGRNIKRFREVFGLKQEALAIELGPDWTQKKVSRLEENEEVSDEILDQVAKALQYLLQLLRASRNKRL